MHHSVGRIALGKILGQDLLSLSLCFKLTEDKNTATPRNERNTELLLL